MSLAENFKKFLDSPEGKASTEKFALKMKQEQEHRDRWVEKFKNRCENDLDTAIEKLLEKYESRKYRNKEYSLGYEPREKLLWLVWEYAAKYCKECTDDTYVNSFTGGMYYIGSYVIQIMYGQGAVLRIDKIS
jgi:hypothetical protein